MTRKSYHGFSGGMVRVYSDTDKGGHGKRLNPRLKLRNHSVTGFAWGYMGLGSAQLALAILCEHLGKGHEKQALALYQEFKQRVIAALPHGQPWTLRDEDVAQAVAEIRKEAAVVAQESVA